jgi:FKBP-type peptidyl-prolyl cis-trans isomerase 2
MKSKKESKESSWNHTNIAVALLVVFVVGSLAAYLTVAHFSDIVENVFVGLPEVVEFGDLVDVHYIGRYTSNDTIFDSSYDDPENKTGGEPLKVFVTLDMNDTPPAEYSAYSNFIGTDFVEGFIEGLVGLKLKESAKIGPLAPEEAYGVSPKEGDILPIPETEERKREYRIVKIEEDVPLPEEFKEFQEYYGLGNITTLYVIRDESRFVGEVLPPDNMTVFYVWKDSTVVTKMNETLIWTYTTPPEDKYENLTWTEVDLSNASRMTYGSLVTYPENCSRITLINETTIIVTHTPEINDTIKSVSWGTTEFVVENITSDKIITYVKEDNVSENKTYVEFNRKKIIQRNQTQNITQSLPREIFEMLLEYLRGFDATLKFNLGPLADESVYFEVEIIKIYRPS